MQLEFEIPDKVPVMTLPHAVLFPQAMMPLHIFEPRYRNMLRDVLRRNRIFAVASLNESLAMDSGQFEPPCKTATMGVVRACRYQSDGTSNLLLQGLYRVKVLRIIREDPYRTISIAVLKTTAGFAPEDLKSLKDKTTLKLEERKKFGGEVPEQILNFMKNLKNDDTFIDLAAFTFCSNYPIKQKLLETLDTSERYLRFLDYLTKENSKLELLQKLRGNLSDDQVEMN